MPELTVTTRFAVGDTVYIVRPSQERVPVTCPDCGGTGSWKVLATGVECEGQFSIPCPGCDSIHHRAGIVWESRAVPAGEEDTIADVGLETRDGEPRAKYFTAGTSSGDPGHRSGSVYYEGDLYADRESALVASQRQLEQREASVSDANAKARRIRRNHGSPAGNMVAYHRAEIRDLKKRLKASERQLAHYMGEEPTS